MENSERNSKFHAFVGALSVLSENHYLTPIEPTMFAKKNTYLQFFGMHMLHMCVKCLQSPLICELDNYQLGTVMSLRVSTLQAIPSVL